jgi:putative endonuclease
VRLCSQSQISRPLAEKFTKAHYLVSQIGESMFYVYVLRSKSHFYVGYTHNLKQRVQQHNAGQNIATKAHAPWEVIFYEAYLEQEDALRREKYLKTTQGKQTLRRMLRAYMANVDNPV